MFHPLTPPDPAVNSPAATVPVENLFLADLQMFSLSLPLCPVSCLKSASKSKQTVLC